MTNNLRIHIGGLVALSCILGACYGPAATMDPEAPNELPPPSYVSIWTDRKSGCDYIIVSRSNKSIAVTPRMWSDGVQMCVESQK